MIVRTWREAFTEAMRSSGDSLDDVVWNNTREDWLASRWVHKQNELVMTEKYHKVYLQIKEKLGDVK